MAKTIASVGLSPNPQRPSLGIAYYLKSQGYKVIPVNPTADKVLNEKSYPDLPSVPVKVDVVQIFRRSEDVPPVVEQAIQIGAKVVWMQEGISNPKAAERARAAGLQVVMERCMMQEHRRLMGDNTS
ncbi:MAG: CoA-binding protein [Chloroflexi bacterium]|nr:CoA-binding protein [Chloroflexota bacterium]